MRGRRQNRIQNFKRHNWLIYFSTSMLQTQFLTDNSSLLARPAMCCTHTNFARSVFFLSNSIHFPGEMSKRHLVEGSDWWNNRLFLRRRYDHPWAETKNKRTSRNTEKIDSWQNPWRPDGLWQQVTTTTAVHSNLTNVHSTSVFINIKHLYRGLP